VNSSAALHPLLLPKCSTEFSSFCALSVRQTVRRQHKERSNFIMLMKRRYLRRRMLEGAASNADGV
jgi:hypothetical protein